jgi:hypothetical protein
LRYVFIAKWGLQMNLMTKTEDLFSLTLDHSEATYLDREKLLERQRRVQAAFDPKGLADLKTMVDAYIAGTRDLSAMEFYLEFEQACALVLFHTLPRRGERNKHANGLQQTYGDHIRLMMLGFDKFDESDMDWVMTRRWMDPISIERPELEESVQRYLDLKFSRSEKVAVWITSALHDYGKIFRRGYGLDAEDAAPLCEDLVEALAPDGMSELIHYGIRNHDLIEYTISGDTPASFITAPLMDVPESVRDRAMPMLGIIQHIGAASLGEGRLSGAKLEIYNACCDGSIVADGSIAARLARLRHAWVGCFTARARCLMLRQRQRHRRNLMRWTQECERILRRCSKTRCCSGGSRFTTWWKRPRRTKLRRSRVRSRRLRSRISFGAMLASQSMSSMPVRICW